jgi:hypothetical protein
MRCRSRTVTPSGVCPPWRSRPGCPLKVSLTDSMIWRSGLKNRVPARAGSPWRAGRSRRSPAAARLRPGRPRSRGRSSSCRRSGSARGRLVIRAGSAVNLASRTSRSSALAPVTAKATRRLCRVQTRCSRSPQNQREWVEQREHDQAHGPRDGERVRLLRPADHAQRADRHYQPGRDEPAEDPPAQDLLAGRTGPALHQPFSEVAVSEPDGLDRHGGEDHPQDLQRQERLAVSDVEDAKEVLMKPNMHPISNRIYRAKLSYSPRRSSTALMIVEKLSSVRIITAARLAADELRRSASVIRPRHEVFWTASSAALARI